MLVSNEGCLEAGAFVSATIQRRMIEIPVQQEQLAKLQHGTVGEKPLDRQL